MDDEILLARAAAGDRAAAGAYLARHLPLLSAAARKLADSRHDPDDLLADAIASLLARWAEGASIDSPRSYLMQSMRNSMIDAARSPRSRVTELDTDVSDPLLPELDAHLELENEIEWLRLALERLPDSQRAVLVEHAGGDTKRIEPETPSDRSKGAAYSLKTRARQSLRRAYLQVVLEEGAPPSCQHAIAAMPQHVGNSPEDTEGVPEHLRQCERCRRRWAVFAGIASTLGIASLVVVSDALSAAPASAAAEARASVDTDASTDASASATTFFTAKKLIITGSTIFAAGIVLTAVAIVSTVGAASLFADAASADFSRVAPNAGRSETGQEARGTAAGRATATLGYQIEAADNGGYEVALDLRVSRAEWATRTLAFDLPEGMRVDSAPEAWHCEANSCTTGQVNASGGIFTLSGHATDLYGHKPSVEIQWSGTAGEQQLFAAAGSSLPPIGTSYSASSRATA